MADYNARLRPLNIEGPPGVTVSIPIVSTVAVSTVVLYLGGSEWDGGADDDADDYTGATAFTATIAVDGLSGSVDVDFPTIEDAGGESLKLRLAVDGAVVAGGGLHLSRLASRSSATPISIEAGSGTLTLDLPSIVSGGGGGGGTDDQTAAEVPFTPAGNLASTDVQDALEELDTEKATTGSVTAAISTAAADATSKANAAQAAAVQRANHTGTQTLSTISDAGTAAAADTGDFATAAQGSTADSAVQPGDLGAVATSNDYDDLDNLPTLGTAAAAATGDFDAAGSAAAAQAAAVQRANHTGTQAQSTVTNLVSDLALKAPLASPALTGTPTAPTAAQGTNTTQVATTAMVQSEVTLLASKTPTVGSALGTTGSIALDMAALNDTYQSIALTGNPTFTTSNRATGRHLTLRLAAGGSSRTLAFPSWIFVGAAAPTTLASGKVGILTVTFFDTTDAGAVAAWAAQP